MPQVSKNMNEIEKETEDFIHQYQEFEFFRKENIETNFKEFLDMEEALAHKKYCRR